MRNFFYLFLFSLLIPLPGCKQSPKKGSTAMVAGFRIVQAVDRSRLYKPNTDSSNYLHFRPVDIDVWYPARLSAKDTALRFHDLLGLLEKRANYYTDSKSAAGYTQQLAQYLCQGFKCSDPVHLLDFKTASFRDAKAADGKFPLLIYLCSYNGMCYENFSLFEDLAKKGFVVMSVSSIGRFPGDMTMRNADMMEQVNDALFSYKTISGSANIDSSKLGILGYSWGGLAGAVLANKIPATACLISLDGSEFHHYGQVHEEDVDFNGIVSNPEFINSSLRVPYLRLESTASDSMRKDSVYDFTKKLSGKKLLLKVRSAGHEDFGCLPDVVRISGGCKTGHHYDDIKALVESYLNDHLQGTDTFTPLLKTQLNKTVEKK
jgi:hypothetical protein